ncbi:MAG: NAD-dependent epimerase/dehydratase family protein [Armatimonadota bacterium]
MTQSGATGKPRLLITGGAGFLGYHLANTLAPRAGRIALTDIADFHASDYPPGAELVRADVRDTRAMGEAMGQGCDVVIHAAAALPLWKKAEIFSVNVEGTRTVLESALKHGVPRVVLVSSTAVYGVPKKHPIEEDDPLIGVGPYGESKIAAERICEEYRGKGLCVPIIRPKTFIGTGRLGVFAILYDWVYSGKRIPVIGSGDNRYQLLEVEDLVEAIWLACTAPSERANATFNVGAREFGTVKHDVGALCAYAGTGARVMPTCAGLVKAALRVFEMLKLSPLYKWVYGTADRDSFVSTERIEKALGWQPRYSNAEALIRSYQWYLDHREEVEAEATGITHRAAWKQGILALFKRLM